jgi:hypothetical protein
VRNLPKLAAQLAAQLLLARLPLSLTGMRHRGMNADYFAGKTAQHAMPLAQQQRNQLENQLRSAFNTWHQ